MYSGNTNKPSVPDMDHFDIAILTEIQGMAAGMSKEEILQTYSIEEKDLDKTELAYFNEYFNYGRGMAVKQVIENLLTQSKTKGGIQASLSYLRQFSSKWEQDESGTAEGSFNFNFTK